MIVLRVHVHVHVIVLRVRDFFFEAHSPLRSQNKIIASLRFARLGNVACHDRSVASNMRFT